MNTPGSDALDPARLAALAARLGLSPAATIVLAARLGAATPDTPARHRLAVELARVHAAPAAVRATAALLRLEPTAYALDELDRLLALTWSPPPAAGA